MLVQADASSKRESITFAAYQASVFLFPKARASFTSFLTALGHDASLTASTDLPTAADVGNVAAAGVILFRSNDNSNYTLI